MSIFDQLKKKAQAAVPSAASSSGNQREVFTFSALPESVEQMRALPEAAMDLGCTPVQAFFKVEIHEIIPGIATGMLMAFTLSLDDFVISYFAAGNSFQTLPIYIYAQTKKRVTPDMNALCSIIFVVILILLLVRNFASSREERKSGKKI